MCILYKLDTKGIVQNLDSSNQTSKIKAVYCEMSHVDTGAEHV